MIKKLFRHSTQYSINKVLMEFAGVFIDHQGNLFRQRHIIHCSRLETSLFFISLLKSKTSLLQLTTYIPHPWQIPLP